MIYVLGGMNLDILASPQSTFRLRDSNVGRVVFRPGGVGRNIAERIASAGEEVSLITVLGGDDRAAYLRKECELAGISLDLSVGTEEATPVYVAVHDDTGDMIAAVNDMQAMRHLTPEQVKKAAGEINRGSVCVLDANLPQETLLQAAESIRIPLLLDTVSCEKARRCVPVLKYLYAIKPNRLEAQALTGEEDPEKAADALLDSGVKQVYISLGREGILYASRSEKGRLQPDTVLKGPLTGAGDALCAGLAVAIKKKMSADKTALYAMNSAEQFLLSQQGGKITC